MSRFLISIGLVVFSVGCRVSGPTGGPWLGSGLQRIPPPPTGSIGKADVPSPYYQPSNQPRAKLSSNLGTANSPSDHVVVAPAQGTGPNNLSSDLSNSVPQRPLNRVVSSTSSDSYSATSTAEGKTSSPLTSIPAKTYPVAVESPGTAPVKAAGVANSWRSPTRMIQSRGSPDERIQDSTMSKTGEPTVTSGQDQSVLVGTPIRIVESNSLQIPPAVAIRPMPVNDATLAVTEPRRLEAGPDQWTEITNLPVVRQSIIDAPKGLQYAQSSVDPFNRGTISHRRSQAGWRAAAPTIRRTQ